MPRVNKQRRAEIEAEIKRKAADAVWDIVRGCHPDKLNVHMLSMSQIARKAGVAKGTLYNYFEDKADLMIFVASQALELYSQEKNKIQRSSMSVKEKLLAITRSSLSLTDEQQRIYYIMAHNRASMPAMQRIYAEVIHHTEEVVTAIIEAGRQQGLFGKYDVTDIVLTFMCMINSCIEAQLHYVADRSVDDKAKMVVEVFLNGACGSG